MPWCTLRPWETNNSHLILGWFKNKDCFFRLGWYTSPGCFLVWKIQCTFNLKPYVELRWYSVSNNDGGLVEQWRNVWKITTIGDTRHFSLLNHDYRRKGTWWRTMLPTKFMAYSPENTRAAPWTRKGMWATKENLHDIPLNPGCFTGILIIPT